MKYQAQLSCFLAGLTISSVAFLFKSPIIVVIGILIAAVHLIEYVCCLLSHKEDNGESIGCMIVALPIIILIGCAIIWDDNTHISGLGDLRHHYADCSKKLNPTKDYEMIEFSAILCGCFNECELCNQKHNEEKRLKKEKKKQEKIKRDLDFINAQIKELKEVKTSLENGNDQIETWNYEFRYQCEDEIIEEYKEVQFEP